MNDECDLPDCECATYQSPEPSTVVTGRDNMLHLRRFCIKQGMEMEFLHNMKLTGKAPSAYVLAKQEMDMPIRAHTGKAGKLHVYFDFCERFGFEPKPAMVEAQAGAKDKNHTFTFPPGSQHR
jgi:hypothetical protein